MEPGPAPTVLSATAESVLSLLPTGPQLLALGEPTHGEEALLDLRNELFAELVEHHGYRLVAIESDCLRGLLVDEYVTSGTGSLDEVMRTGFSHEWGAFEGNRALVRWMRAYNEARTPSEHVRFAGFDGPLEMTAAASPRHALVQLHAYLAARVEDDLLPCSAGALDDLAGDDDRWTNPAAMMDPTQSIGRSSEARQLRLLADDLVALLDAQAPLLTATSTDDEWDRARLFGRTARGLLRYHHWMADTSPGRMSWLLAVRDSMMAANLRALAGRRPTLASGHNAHFQRDRSSMRLGDQRVAWWSAGALVSGHPGSTYAFVATALGTIQHRGVDAPPPDTIEGLLYEQAPARCLVDPRHLAAVLDQLHPTPRSSPWYGYAPLDPAHVRNLDGIVFVKDAVPLTSPG